MNESLAPIRIRRQGVRPGLLSSTVFLVGIESNPRHALVTPKDASNRFMRGLYCTLEVGSENETSRSFEWFLATNLRQKLLAKMQSLFLLPFVTLNVSEFHVSPTLIAPRADIYSLNLVWTARRCLVDPVSSKSSRSRWIGLVFNILNPGLLFCCSHSPAFGVT